MSVGDERVVELAWRALEQVHDPEIPAISIVDLGIVREIVVSNNELIARLTPTYSGCPAVEVIEADALSALGEVDCGLPTRVERVLEPAWTTAWITVRGRERLRSAGIAPPSGEHAVIGGRAPAKPFAVLGGPELPSPACPRCGSDDVELISAFGSTACKSIWRCTSCREPFDHFKEL